MERTGLRYFLAPVWILNMVFLFGSIYSRLKDENGILSTPKLILIGVPFILFIYLFKDITSFRRKKLLQFIGVIFLSSSIYYLFIKSFLIIPFTLVSGILILIKTSKD